MHYHYICIDINKTPFPKEASARNYFRFFLIFMHGTHSTTAERRVMYALLENSRIFCYKDLADYVQIISRIVSYIVRAITAIFPYHSQPFK